MLSVHTVAAIAGTSRHTVEREIRRGNLSAQRVGRHWAINPWEARRWAAQFRPYRAGTRHRAIAL